MRWARLGIGWIAAILAASLVPAAGAAAAPSDFPVKIRLVDTAVEQVMLQMTVDGQQDQSGGVVQFYGPGGALTSTFTIPSAVAVGLSGRTILLAPAASSPSPDFDIGTSDRLDPLGGAVCFVASPEPDCVSWGSFPLASLAALPDPLTSNATVASPLGRLITADCTTWLGPLDDDDDSAQDFATGVVAPRHNSTAPSSGEAPCQLETGWNLTPGNPTNDTTPTFAFGSVPADYALFMCSFDSAPFTECDPAGVTYGPLADGTYNLRAYAQNAAGADPTPVSWTFDVDTAPPDTIVDSVPASPSSGFSATFAFHSTEPQSRFLCQFETGPIQPCESPKTIFALADGSHAFRVWAVDQATNQDPTAAVTTFTVDTALGDRTPPDTTIISRPKDPAASPSASFAYRSNEPRSTFECSLDARPFASCPAIGISYAGLKNGPHTFAARAIDRAGNTDSVPATYSWTVKAPLPETTIVSSPPGAQRIRGRGRSTRVSFAFRSSKASSSFRCRLDGAPFRTCKSPVKLKARVGRHRFEVYALDSLGNEEATPARRIFRVLPKRRGGGLFRVGVGW